MYWYRKALSCPVKWIKQRNRSPALVNSKVKGISAYIHTYIHTYLYILFILLEDNHLQDDPKLKLIYGPIIYWELKKNRTTYQTFTKIKIRKKHFKGHLIPTFIKV